jgi:hypothetical protein
VSASASAIVGPRAAGNFGHRLRLTMLIAAMLLLLVSVAAYGADYYLLALAERPFSPKHALLKPSGTLGLKLGMLGFFCFVCLFLYPLRKRVKWLARRGVSKHWLDFHVVLGLTSPVIIALHSSFKFHGIAGMAFWTMFAVVLSGIIGRYVFAQIPRKLNSVEMSIEEAGSALDELASRLSGQRLFSAEELDRVLHLPGKAEVEAMPLLSALGWMIRLDLERPWVLARLRRRHMSRARSLATAGGLLPCGDERIEQVIRTVRKRAALGKRALFLRRTQRVFHLWHVIHRPFSYSFVVLAALHILVALLFGFM